MSQQDKDLQQEQQLLQHFRQHGQGEPSAALDALILDAARQAVAQPPARPSRAQRLHAWLFGNGSRTRWSVAFAGLATLGIGLSLTWRTQEQAPSAYDLPAPVVTETPAAPMLREMAPGMAKEARQQSAEFERKKAEAVQKKAAAVEAMADAIDPDASSAAPAPAASMARQMPLAKPPAAPPAEALSDAATSRAGAGSPAEEAKSEAYIAARAKAEAVAKAKAQAEEQARAKQQSRVAGQFLVQEAPALELRLREVLRLREEGRPTEADQLLQALRPEYPQLDLDAELKRLQAETEKPASAP